MNKNNNDVEEFEEISKSELKREAHKMQELGEYLTTLQADVWNELPISDSLYQALSDNYKHSKEKQSKRRHLQFIGKLMKKEDVDAINDALFKFSDEYKNNLNNEVAIWRDKLIFANAFDEFASIYYKSNKQQLRDLIKKAINEQQIVEKVATKKLFQLIKTIITESRE